MIVTNRPPQVASLNTATIRRALRATRIAKKKATDAEKLFINLCVKFLKDIVEPQLIEGKFNLNIEDNSAIAEKLNCSPRQVRSIKQRLSTAEIIFVPEGGRQTYNHATRKGTHATWLVNFEFVNMEEDEKKERTQRTFYDERYQAALTWAKNIVRGRLEEMGYENINVSRYMAAVYTELNEILESEELSRELCKL